MHPLTPDYASPEQVRGDEVTPASDLFSLGVLLYELVTGIRPYAVKNPTAFEVERAILDTTPMLPSTQAYRNGALAAELRGTTPDKLRCLLKGDIDNIILVALRTAPERRYTTASALGDDIRRHLEALPVAARSDSIDPGVHYSPSSLATASPVIGLTTCSTRAPFLSTALIS